MTTAEPLIHVSRLATSADEVWKVAATMEGVNAELMPLVRMTSPSRFRSMTLPEMGAGPAFRSVLLAGGIVPFDVHSLAFDEVGDLGFDERSTSLLNREWRHRRTVTPGEGGCTVTDELWLTLRLRPAQRPTAVLIGQVFAHRHRRLRSRFGSADR